MGDILSYQTISVKEAIDRINSRWFLPSIQRPYVWGSRYQNELYICKLFDSLLRGYPIGTLILWETETEIPYREFAREYDETDYESGTKIVDTGRWKATDKSLVYDGQQRLQTLYSCLKYTLNGKTLHFNLLFDMKKSLSEDEDIGFTFFKKDEKSAPHYIRMTEVFHKNAEEKVKFRKEVLERCHDLNEDERNQIEENIDNLWRIFVERDKKALAYFPISFNDERMVNEIFQRLNTGGVPLSQADLLFSSIKEKSYDFEEKLQRTSVSIYNNTGRGYTFDAGSILQLMHLIIKGNTRIDPNKVKHHELVQFTAVWGALEKPIFDFFVDFIWGEFKINNKDIIPKKLALLPMLVYFYHIYKKGLTYKDIEEKNIIYLKQFLILSQINDWNTQGLINDFSETISTTLKTSNDFPLPQFITTLNQTKKRNTDLFESNFIDYKWFTLKILTPQRFYQFDPDVTGRFNPEIDHIFPKHLKNQPPEYKQDVDVIWNMQPIKGDVNNYKLDTHPKIFFSSEVGKKYLDQYDHLPTTDFTQSLWDNHRVFIEKRREIMIEFLKNKYGLVFKAQ